MTTRQSSLHLLKSLILGAQHLNLPNGHHHDPPARCVQVQRMKIQKVERFRPFHYPIV